VISNEKGKRDHARQDAGKINRAARIMGDADGPRNETVDDREDNPRKSILGPV